MIDLNAKTTGMLADQFGEFAKHLRELANEARGVATKGDVQVAPVLTREVVPWADKLADLLDDAHTRAGMISEALAEFPRATPWGQK